MTQHYLVVGNPIAQSKSPQIHQAFAEQTGEQLTYTKSLVELEGFNAFATQFFAQDNNHGMNITMPFKGDAHQFADELTDNARLACAVNTLMKCEDGRIIGENTDGLGLVWHITQYLKWSIKDKKVLVIGAGGAVRGVLLPLLKENPNSIWVVNRTASKATDLAHTFNQHGTIKGTGFDALSAINTPFDMVINATSTSLTGDLPPIPDHALAAHTCVYDMVYANEPTPFMAHAQTLGVKHTSDGLGMLAGQAAQSFKLWRNVMPDTAKVINTLRQG